MLMGSRSIATSATLKGRLSPGASRKLVCQHSKYVRGSEDQPNLIRTPSDPTYCVFGGGLLRELLAFQAELLFYTSNKEQLHTVSFVSTFDYAYRVLKRSLAGAAGLEQARLRVAVLCTLLRHARVVHDQRRQRRSLLKKRGLFRNELPLL